MSSTAAAALAWRVPDPDDPNDGGTTAMGGGTPPATIDVAPTPTGAGASTQDQLKTGLELIAAYIPAQALALFVSIYGFLNPPESASGFRLLLVLGGFVAVVLAVWAGFDFRLRLSAKRRAQLAWLWLFGILAFFAWVLAMPGGPLAVKVNVLGYDTTTTTLGGVLVLVLAAGLPGLARRVGVRS